MTIEEQLAQIVPGKNYPTSAKVTETIEGKVQEVKFLLQSYLVGVYCAMYYGPAVPYQTGDHDNRTFVGKLKKDLAAALKRGAQVEIGTLMPVL